MLKITQSLLPHFKMKGALLVLLFVISASCTKYTTRSVLEDARNIKVKACGEIYGNILNSAFSAPIWEIQSANTWIMEAADIVNFTRSHSSDIEYAIDSMPDNNQLKTKLESLYNILKSIPIYTPPTRYRWSNPLNNPFRAKRNNEYNRAAILLNNAKVYHDKKHHFSDNDIFTNRFYFSNDIPFGVSEHSRGNIGRFGNE